MHRSPAGESAGRRAAAASSARSSESSGAADLHRRDGAQPAGRSGSRTGQRAGGGAAASSTGRPASPAAFSRWSSAASSARRPHHRARCRGAAGRGKPRSSGPCQTSAPVRLAPDVQQVGLAAARLAPQRQTMVRPRLGAAQPRAGLRVRWSQAEIRLREPWAAKDRQRQLAGASHRCTGNRRSSGVKQTRCRGSVPRRSAPGEQRDSN